MRVDSVTSETDSVLFLKLKQIFVQIVDFHQFGVLAPPILQAANLALRSLPAYLLLLNCI